MHFGAGVLRQSGLRPCTRHLVTRHCGRDFSEAELALGQGRAAPKQPPPCRQQNRASVYISKYSIYKSNTIVLLILNVYLQLDLKTKAFEFSRLHSIAARNTVSNHEKS